MRKRIEQAPPAVAADRVFTIAEVAARWRVDRHTVYAAIKAGRLQVFKPDLRIYRIREAELLRYEQENRAAVAS